MLEADCAGDLRQRSKASAKAKWLDAGGPRAGSQWSGANVPASPKSGQNWLALDTVGWLDTVEAAPSTTCNLRAEINETSPRSYLDSLATISIHSWTGTRQAARGSLQYAANIGRDRRSTWIESAHAQHAPPSRMRSSSLKCLTPRCGSCQVQHKRLDVTIRAAIANRHMQLGQTPGGHLLVAEKKNRKNSPPGTCATFLTWCR